MWTKLPVLAGTNVIYNSLNKETRTLYSVNTEENDQISLIFGDNIFSEIPRGNFRMYYRESNGLEYYPSTSGGQWR